MIQCKQLSHSISRAEGHMYTTIVGNPYEFFNEGDTICTTTNGILKNDGHAVMGAGNAAFVRDVFGVDKRLGEFLKRFGNRAFYLGEHIFPSRPIIEQLQKNARNKEFYVPDKFSDSYGKQLKLATFPTKHHWRNDSDLNLIQTSAEQIVAIANKFHLNKVYIPLPGGSHGNLKWSQVKDRLSCLDERFVIYSLNAEDFSK